MPLDQSTAKELKDMITLARKRELNFGLCLGKKPENMVLVTHKTKAPAAMGKQAKADGETPQFTFGKLSAEGKDLTLVCEGKIHAGMNRKVRELLKAAGLSLKIHVTDPDGNAADQEEDADAGEANEEEAQAAASETPAAQEEAATQDAPAGADAPPVKVGAEPSKGDLMGEFADVRKNLMKSMGQLEGDVQAVVQSQIKQFGEMMKSKDFEGAQALMDNMAIERNAVSDAQRQRARDDLAQIDSHVGDIEAELDALEAELNTQEAAA